MFELMMTGLGVGLGQFISSMITSNEWNGNYNFNIGPVNTKIDYNAKLDLSKKNLHVTVDLDLNF